MTDETRPELDRIPCEIIQAALQECWLETRDRKEFEAAFHLVAKKIAQKAAPESWAELYFRLRPDEAGKAAE
jgi:hypothetical protein